MDTSIREELACMAQRRWDRTKEVTIVNVVRFLFDMGWIDPTRVRRAIIKDFYFQMLKHNKGNAHESRLDVQANYDVSEGYIKDILYRFRAIK
jgi:hypothetical protein